MNVEGRTATPRRQFIIHHWAEITLVFAVFFLQGAAAVPEVNEPYYLGKAIHYWNPDWAPGDFFLQSKDTHEVFYFTFGWLSLWLSPTVLAWFGRVLTWGLLAWAWRRLSFAVVPRPWFSVLSAALLVCLIERCHMAGEWIVGGVEAKGFAFVLVFLGLEALVLGRWNRVWLLLGAASAFHVLVGGWSAVAAGLVWLVLGKDRPSLWSMGPALLGGLVFSLPGLIPSLILNWGVDGEVTQQANQVYVYARLAHHLSPGQFPASHVGRFAGLVVLWLVFCFLGPNEAGLRRLQAFVTAAITIALAGMGIGLLGLYDSASAAGLLRLYWFRLADVAVPLGVALAATSFVARNFRWRSVRGRCSLGVAILIGGMHFGAHFAESPFTAPPPADRLPNHAAWRAACDWVVDSGEIPPDARFITPRMAQTFKWYTGRSEVANWKEIPQDARGIVEWWRRNVAMHATGHKPPQERWHESLAEVRAERLKPLATKYQADYLITIPIPIPRLPCDIVYENRQYIIYRLHHGREN